MEFPVRGCQSGLSGAKCASTSFPTTGGSYNHVCGRIVGYQKGATDGFDVRKNAKSTIDDPYMDGLSLTHGLERSRQHVWSFVAAYNDEVCYTDKTCPYSNNESNRSHSIPSFAGQKYFCDTGRSEPGFSLNTTYDSDPLWDGRSCAARSICCEFNTPPCFYVTLPRTTSDDLEPRICINDGHEVEDIIIICRVIRIPYFLTMN